jgi:hypothetical protein
MSGDSDGMEGAAEGWGQERRARPTNTTSATVVLGARSHKSSTEERPTRSLISVLLVTREERS